VRLKDIDQTLVLVDIYLSHNQKRHHRVQTYCVIIACLLISVWTGRKPTKRTYEMIYFYFLGLA